MYCRVLAAGEPSSLVGAARVHMHVYVKSFGFHKPLRDAVITRCDSFIGRLISQLCARVHL